MAFMEWEVVYYQSERGESPIEKFLLSLSDKARAKCLLYVEALEERGLSLPASFASKVAGDLWELRPEFGGVEHRLFYFTYIQRQIVIVHAVKKKSQKLKPGDVALAQARVEEVRRREKAREEQTAQRGSTYEITPAIRRRTDRKKP